MLQLFVLVDIQFSAHWSTATFTLKEPVKRMPFSVKF